MATYHPLLLRQLQRLGIDPAQAQATPGQLGPLLARISRSYEDADKEQYLSRRAQELSSREMEQLYQRLAEAQRLAGLGNWIFDLRAGLGRWSEECARVFGLDPAGRMPGLRALLARVHEDSRRAFLEALTAAARQRRPFEIELRLLPHNGRTRWVNVVGQPMPGEDGEMRRLHGTVMDITRRKLTALSQSVEHTVAGLLAEAQAPLDAMPRILEAIGTTLGWPCGAYWKRDERGDGVTPVFRRATTWAAPARGLERFLVEPGSAVGRAGTEGLIARAAQAGEPLWVTDAASDELFEARRAAAIAARVRSAFAFPVLVGGKAAGVLEFLDRRMQLPDEDLLESARSVGRQIGQFLQRKRAEEHVRHLAYHDTLTNLPNRAMFSRHLGRAIPQAARHGKRLAVLFIDLDRFKIINDTLGHHAGDRLLKEMSRRLAASLRQGDVVSRLGRKDRSRPGEVLARLGGDEFVVLLEDLPDASQAGAVAAKLLGAMLEPYRLESHPVHVTASIGIAIFPDDGLDEGTLMKHADIAMYRSKEAGRNNFQFYSERINGHSSALLALESDLRCALQRGELRLQFQPRFDAISGRISGTEALLRWQHPSLGLLPPDDFIPIAEETGLIVPIGKWVLEQACARNVAWQQRGLPPLRIAVNLSARQFAHERLLDDIAACLHRTGMDPHLLELEITESTVMHDPDQVAFLLDRLRATGVRVAIDDFGAGYSSLLQLKRLPIDVIKIDRSFIKDCPDDPVDVAITRAVIGIGRSLNLQVVAEGVETAPHLRFLRDSGCSEMQGFLLSTPLNPDEFLRLHGGGGSSAPSAAPEREALLDSGAAESG